MLSLPCSPRRILHSPIPALAFVIATLANEALLWRMSFAKTRQPEFLPWSCRRSVVEAPDPVFYQQPLLKPYVFFDVSHGREQPRRHRRRIPKEPGKP